LLIANRQVAVSDRGSLRERVIQIHIRAYKAWRVEILVVLDCELASNLSFESEFAEKWKILSRSCGAWYLEMN
jgi:hypothetical protein